MICTVKSRVLTSLQIVYEREIYCYLLKKKQVNIRDFTVHIKIYIVTEIFLIIFLRIFCFEWMNAPSLLNTIGKYLPLFKRRKLSLYWVTKKTTRWKKCKKLRSLFTFFSNAAAQRYFFDKSQLGLNSERSQ